MPKQNVESGETFLKLERRYDEQILPTAFPETEYYEQGYEDDEIHLREYLQRVIRHKWIVVIITVLLTAAAGIYLFNQPNVFQSEARVQVDSENEAGLDTSKGSVSPFEDRAYFNTQLELIESPELIRRVIKKLDLASNLEFLNGLPKFEAIRSTQQTSSTAKKISSEGPESVETDNLR